MPRLSKRRGKTAPVVEDIDFRHASRHADLEALLADHLLGPDAAATISDWSPTRRGNSPHHSDRGPV